MPQTPSRRPSLPTPYVAPRNALETRLTDIWEEVLAVVPIGMDDDFFDLGGESVQAFSIIARVLRDFEVKLSARDLFACASVGAMAAVVAERQQRAERRPAQPGANDRGEVALVRRRRTRTAG